MNDSGNIKCVATNILGRATTVANLQIEASPRLELPENYNDGLIFRYDEVIWKRRKNENNQLLLSQVIRMKIPVIAKPPPRITWFFDDEPVAVNEDVQVGKINLFLLFILFIILFILLFIILNCLVLLVNIILLTSSCRSRSQTLSPA